jgi:hypothetical protein
MCAAIPRATTTVIEFRDQNGWPFVVRIGSDDEGTWSATKDTETPSGVAIAPFGE